MWQSPLRGNARGCVLPRPPQPSLLLLHFSQAAYSPGSKSTCWGDFSLLGGRTPPDVWKQRVMEGPHLPISTTAASCPGHSSQCYGRCRLQGHHVALGHKAATSGCRQHSTAHGGGLWIRQGVAGRQSQPSLPGRHRAAPSSLTAHFLFRSCSDTEDVIAGAGPSLARSPTWFTRLLLKPEEN